LLDQNPIALWTVDRVEPLALQLGRSGLQALLRNGDVVEARVIAMLDKDVAQLEILGQKVEVSTPQALRAGSTISVAINRSGQSLELVIRPETNTSRPPSVPQTGSGSGRGSGVVAETIGSFLSVVASIEDRVLAAQAAINGAVLSSEANFQSANPGLAQPSFNSVMQAYSAATLPSQVQLQAEVRARYELDSTPWPPHSAEDYDSGAPSSPYEASQLRPQSALPSAPGQQSSDSALAIVVPFQLPQMPHPILMTIQQEDEDEAQQTSRSPAAKRWTVNFSLDAGSVGQVNVTIALSAAAVSVRLSSDEAASATFLSTWLPELKTTLEEADFAVEELSVRGVRCSDTANNAPVLL
jgi:hypothetical protein